MAVQQGMEPIIDEQLCFVPGTSGNGCDGVAPQALVLGSGMGRSLYAERTLREHGALAWAIATVLRELVGQRAWRRVAGVCSKFPVELGMGAQQGGSDIPFLWDDMVSATTKPRVQPWEAEPAVVWCPEFAPLPIMCYAVNAYLESDSRRKLQDHSAAPLSGLALAKACRSALLRWMCCAAAAGRPTSHV